MCVCVHVRVCVHGRVFWQNTYFAHRFYELLIVLKCLNLQNKEIGFCMTTSLNGKNRGFPPRFIRKNSLAMDYYFIPFDLLHLIQKA